MPATRSKYPKFANFGELLYWSYANLQMLVFALQKGKAKYDTSCFMIRAKAFKAYKDGRWTIRDLMQFNVSKIRNNDFCWYCGCELPPSELTIDHVFPRSKGGDNNMDNIMMVCKSCNSSKGNMDLFQWYCVVRQTFPPIPVATHYLKNIYLYAVEHDLMGKHSDEIDSMDLPFNWRFIPLEYPEPDWYYEDEAEDKTNPK